LLSVGNNLYCVESNCLLLLGHQKWEVRVVIVLWFVRELAWKRRVGVGRGE